LLLGLDTFLFLLTQFAIYFPSGYLLVNDKIKSVPFVIKIPVFISLGLITDTIILSIIAIVYIGNGTLIALGAVSYGILIFRIYRLRFQKEQKYTNVPYYSMALDLMRTVFNFKRIPNVLRTVRFLVPTVLFLLVIVHFSMVVGYMHWPPGLDAINSGLLTSLLVHSQRLQTSLVPIAPSQPWFEPFGLHVMAANSTFMYSIFPGEAVLLMATAAIILILLLIYSIIFILTKSTAFSTLGLIAGFYIYPVTSDIRFLEKWLIGYYYNTPYPTLLGYLALLVFMTTWLAIFDDSKRKKTKSRISQLISLAGIGVTYTPFILLPTVYVFLSYLTSNIPKFLHMIRGFIMQKRLKNCNFSLGEVIKRKKRTLVIIAGISSILIIIIISQSFFSTTGDRQTAGLIKLLERIHANSYFYTAVVLRPDFFTNFTGIWTLIATGAAILSIIRRNRSNLSIFFLLFSAPIIGSSIGGKIINDHIWFLLHGRLFAFLIILDWILISTYLSDLVRWTISTLTSRIPERRYLDNNKVAYALRTTISLVLIVTFFIPSLVSHGTLEQAVHWDWIFGSPHFRNDYNLLAWVSHNINTSDLIMIDYTYTSKSIHSFSLKNTTHNAFPHTQTEIERDKNNAVTWDRPTFLRSFVDRYDVKFILLDSEPSHRLPPEVGGDDKYSARLFDAKQYREVLDHMPFLKLIKEFGSSALYEVTR
jgi:hypothetical protein